MSNHTIGVTDVLDQHGGWVVRTESIYEGMVTLHVAFRNMVDKGCFVYAMRTAWPEVIVHNYQGQVRMNVTVPFGLVKAA
jgi:hypothetical protein